MIQGPMSLDPHSRVRPLRNKTAETHAPFHRCNNVPPEYCKEYAPVKLREWPGDTDFSAENVEILHW